MQVMLPWPARELSPNSRVHWAKKAKASKAARLYAFVKTKEAYRAPVDFTKPTLHIQFFKPSARRMDLDNMLASIKPMHSALMTQGSGWCWRWPTIWSRAAW